MTGAFLVHKKQRRNSPTRQDPWPICTGSRGRGGGGRWSSTLASHPLFVYITCLHFLFTLFVYIICLHICLHYYLFTLFVYIVCYIIFLHYLFASLAYIVCLHYLFTINCLHYLFTLFVYLRIRKRICWSWSWRAWMSRRYPKFIKLKSIKKNWLILLHGNKNSGWVKKKVSFAAPSAKLYFLFNSPVWCFINIFWKLVIFFGYVMAQKKRATFFLSKSEEQKSKNV